MAKVTLKPYRQGHLDGYCGIYCVINIVHYLRGPLDESHANKLFCKKMKSLNQKKDLVERINVGTNLKKLGELLDITLVRYQLRHKRLFHRNKGVSLDHYWYTLQTFISTRKGIVLICIGGLYNHWTLVRDVTSKSFLLFDSDGIKHLSRVQCCTTSEQLSHRHHLLIPTHTVFIWGDERLDSENEVTYA